MNLFLCCCLIVAYKRYTWARDDQVPSITWNWPCLGTMSKLYLAINSHYTDYNDVPKDQLTSSVHFVNSYLNMAENRYSSLKPHHKLGVPFKVNSNSKKVAPFGLGVSYFYIYRIIEPKTVDDKRAFWVFRWRESKFCISTVETSRVKLQDVSNYNLVRLQF